MRVSQLTGPGCPTLDGRPNVLDVDLPPDAYPLAAPGTVAGDMACWRCQQPLSAHQRSPQQRATYCPSPDGRSFRTAAEAEREGQPAGCPRTAR